MFLRSDATKEALLHWSRHDGEAERFCVLDGNSAWRGKRPAPPRLTVVVAAPADEESPDAQYVDLLLNPERYTGYRGAEAWQIWSSIYEENCFK